ncbi:alanyl-tRNA editing protein [Candidatus Woesearchaeota archaeon]|mgnify:CR=1 FL=1|jgi:misacylated tRNA(Ala) deacylase|nr:alanyl-tRNA editing protein [Candidatus Woesearchaeota archaeon]
MTELLYLKDSYAKEFEATIVSVEGKFIILDKTLFYPQSGGQPTDIGTIKLLEAVEDCDCESTDGATDIRVVFAKKMGGNVSHELETEDHGLKQGDLIKGIIDWDTRYLHMRYHTACHLLSTIVHNATGALITGNQIGVLKSRVDFDLENFDREQIKSYEEKTNELITRELDVKCRELPREEAFQIPSVLKLKNVLPPSIEIIRIVDVSSSIDRGNSVDIQACGGTHIKNTKEIGLIEIIKAENKGKNNRRIVFKLKD